MTARRRTSTTQHTLSITDKNMSAIVIQLLIQSMHEVTPKQFSLQLLPKAVTVTQPYITIQ